MLGLVGPRAARKAKPRFSKTAVSENRGFTFSRPKPPEKGATCGFQKPRFSKTANLPFRGQSRRKSKGPPPITSTVFENRGGKFSPISEKVIFPHFRNCLVGFRKPRIYLFGQRAAGNIKAQWRFSKTADLPFQWGQSCQKATPWFLKTAVFKNRGFTFSGPEPPEIERPTTNYLNGF